MRLTNKQLLILFLFIVMSIMVMFFLTSKVSMKKSPIVKALSYSNSVSFQMNDEKDLPTPIPPRTTTTISVTTTMKSVVRQHRDHSSVNWDAIARCESSGNWASNTGNGYYGGLQMNMSFWNSYAPRKTIVNPDESTSVILVASRPDLATKSDQIFAAIAAYRTRGVSPWPTCGKYG